MEMSGLLGGIAIDVGIGNLSNSTGVVPSSQWPDIAEVYTATWCGNCLDSEHAIEELNENAPLKHSTIIVSTQKSRIPLGPKLAMIVGLQDMVLQTRLQLMVWNVYLLLLYSTANGSIRARFLRWQILFLEIMR